MRRVVGLPPGPWHDEPDKVQWYDDATGMACLIVRQRLGALCGYVGVDPDHPWHGLGYGDVAPGPDVHGGLTFADACQEDGEVCHVPALGRSADVWWFGFDCCHAFDLVPAVCITGSTIGIGVTYRDLDYVKAEVTNLANHLAAVAAQ